MKKTYITILAALAVFTGCNQHVIEVAQDGQLSLSMSAAGEYAPVNVNSNGKVTPATKAGAAEDVNEFTIDIVRNSDGYTKSFARFGDMPQIVNLPSGVYTLKASSPDVLPAAFDQPVYGANHTFTVNVGKTSTEEVVCTLQNIMVTFTLTEAFTTELSSYTISVSNGDASENTLIWTNIGDETSPYVTKDVSKAGYFAVAPLKVRVDGKRYTDGSEAYHEITLLDVTAKTHLDITLDAKVTGSAGFQITIDPSVNSRPEDVFVPGFDETPVPDEDDSTGSGSDNTGGGDDNTGGGNTGDGGTVGPVDDMELLWPGNESLAQSEIVDGMEVELTVNVPGKIKEFTIDVTSDTQMFLFLVSKMTSNPGTIGSIESVSIDLINDATAVSKMRDVGLKTGDQIYDKETVTFSLSALIPMIPSAGQAGPDTYHTFKLNVTDQDGDSKSWPLVFHVPASNQ